MELFQIIILALIQGLTEFLPISSSAHLILPSQLLGWSDQGLAFDVAVHLGSLLAVVIYFRQDLINLTSAWLISAGGLRMTVQHRDEVLLAWKVVLATLPAVIAALLLGDFIEANLRSAWVIAAATVFFGLLLGLAEWRARKSDGLSLPASSEIQMLGWRIAFLIGIAQSFALIPGTSRSGVTMTAAILLGLSRTGAAKFSFLLSIPIITAAGLYASLDLLSQGQAVDWLSIALGTVVSGLSAWLCIAVFMKLIERVGLMPFVWYRLALGLVLIVVLLSR